MSSHFAAPSITAGSRVTVISPLPASCMSIDGVPIEAKLDNDELIEQAQRLQCLTAAQLVTLLLEYTPMARDVIGIVVEYVPHLWVASSIGMRYRRSQPFSTFSSVDIQRVLQHGWCVRQVVGWSSHSLDCLQFVYGPPASLDPTNLRPDADLSTVDGFITTPDLSSHYCRRRRFMRLAPGEIIQSVRFYHLNVHSDIMSLVTSTDREFQVSCDWDRNGMEALSQITKVRAPEDTALIAVERLNSMRCIFASIDGAELA